MANLFMANEPLAGHRHVEVTERRTSIDFARFLKVRQWRTLRGRRSRIRLVCDNLSTHAPAALYEASEPAGARRLAQRFEWHHTPRYGSWLNVAEVAEVATESAGRQCLDRRIPDRQTLERGVVA
jgi:transposase